MSLDATLWAWKIPGKDTRPIGKLILLSLADRADEQDRAWPSLRRLMADTGCDRKTCIESLQRLVALGLIEDTGARVGQGVKVYRLVGVEHREGVPKTVPVPETVLVPKTGLVPKTVLVPKTEREPVPKTERDQYRKRDTEPPIEPLKESKSKKPTDVGPQQFVFSVGLDLLTDSGVKPPQARSYLGGLVKDHGAERVQEAICKAMTAEAGEPKAYIKAILMDRTQSREDEFLAEFGRGAI